MQIKTGISFTKEQLFELYENVQWTAYLKNPDLLWESINKSLEIICLYKENMLVGLLRLLGDGMHTILIQDIIVKTELQSQGYGSQLMKYVLDKYKDVRQILLICDKNEKLEKFYIKHGLKNINEMNCVCFVKF